MFTGIIQSVAEIAHVSMEKGLMRCALSLEDEWRQGLKKGASVSLDGVCLTVVGFDQNLVWLDIIDETLKRTTLVNLKAGQKVNLERAARFGDEIGGHLLSGHIYGTARVENIISNELNRAIFFKCPQEWMKYFFSKGYIALNGVSLTLVDVDSKGIFSVHFIPETLSKTTFGNKQKGELVNVEIDSQTQAVVETVERLQASKSTS